jgi:hypothetical protein
VVSQRPSWQVDPCPSWCVGEHLESDHPDDRQHRSASFSVAVIARRTELGPDRLVRSAEPTEFEVGLSRTDGEQDTWLYIGEGPGMSIEITAESARRLLGAAHARLDAT